MLMSGNLRRRPGQTRISQSRNDLQLLMQGQTVWVEMKDQTVSTQMSEAFQKVPLTIPIRAVHYQNNLVLSKRFLRISGLEDRSLAAGEHKDEEFISMIW